MYLPDRPERLMATNIASQSIKNIWMLTREYAGLAGAGGVKDVSRQLSEALVRSGRQVSVVLPLYGFMNPQELGFVPLTLSFSVDMPYVGVERQEHVQIYSQKHPPRGKSHPQKKGSSDDAWGGVRIYLLGAERFEEKRSVYTYTADDEKENPSHRQGSGHYDYFAMNVLLQKAAIALMLLKNEQPDIIHCHDGHTAILPAMIREIEGYRHYFRNTATVVTIHNAGIGYHQEVPDIPFAQTITGLPSKIIYDNLLDNNFDPFLAASAYSTMNTVSENYARELRESNNDALTGWLGHRLLARGIKLEGVTNGINPVDFDPSEPEKLGLVTGFSPGKGSLAGKKKCRQKLVQDLSENLSTQKIYSTISQTGFLDNRPGQPLFTFVGRFSEQKGVDILLGAIKTLLPQDHDFQILILGTGPRETEQALLDLANKSENRGRISILLGYDTLIAHQVYAAGDFFLVPSRYEPCGLTDFIAQLFGNLPIVHHIGGLVKVIDGVTGFAYHENSTSALVETMRRAIALFREAPEQLLEMQKAAVQNIYKNYSWDIVLKRYITLYQEAFSLIHR